MRQWGQPSAGPVSWHEYPASAMAPGQQAQQQATRPRPPPSTTTPLPTPYLLAQPDDPPGPPKRPFPTAMSTLANVVRQTAGVAIGGLLGEAECRGAWGRGCAALQARAAGAVAPRPPPPALPRTHCCLPAVPTVLQAPPPTSGGTLRKWRWRGAPRSGGAAPMGTPGSRCSRRTRRCHPSRVSGGPIRASRRERSHSRCCASSESAFPLCHQQRHMNIVAAQRRTHAARACLPARFPLTPPERNDDINSTTLPPPHCNFDGAPPPVHIPTGALPSRASPCPRLCSFSAPPSSSRSRCRLILPLPA